MTSNPEYQAAEGTLADDISEAWAREELPAGAEDLDFVVRSLRQALRPQAPRMDFADELGAELLGEPQLRFARLRQMPARVHFAAALAVIAGFALFILRRLVGSDAPQEMQEEAVASPL